MNRSAALAPAMDDVNQLAESLHELREDLVLEVATLFDRHRSAKALVEGLNAVFSRHNRLDSRGRKSHHLISRADGDRVYVEFFDLMADPVDWTCIALHGHHTWWFEEEDVYGGEECRSALHEDLAAHCLSHVWWAYNQNLDELARLATPLR